jgi:glycosyltransferase involved in cell wall biosynthesis
MRVTHVITRLIVGGAQENTIASVLGLQRQFHIQVRLISGPTTGPEGSLEPEVARFPDLLTILPTLVRPIHPWKDWLAWRRLVCLFREQRPDIVHTHSGKAGFLGRLAAQRASVPVIVHTIHGPSFGSFQGRLANGLYLIAERVAARATTHFVSVADAMTRQYLQAGIGRPSQYTRVLSGFDLQPFLAAKNNPALRAQHRIGPNDIVIGKIARLFERKGHAALFAVAPSIVRECRGVKFLLVGGGAWQDRFQQEAHELGLQEHFVFTGLVPTSEVPQLIGIMDLVVHLSEREGLPRALPQALAAGKPVVSFDRDGAGEVCKDGETGYLIRPGDLRQLTERLLQLTRDPALRTQLGRRGRALVKESFAVDKMVEDLYGLYRRLLAQAAAS